MAYIHDKTGLIRMGSISIALSIAVASASASFAGRSAEVQNASGTMPSSNRMADGKQWTTRNLDVDTVSSY